MIIRKAILADTSEIADLLLLAMKDIIYHFIGVRNYEEARNFVLKFLKEKSNQYSYENCWVVEIDKAVVAVANMYDGAKLTELRKPVVDYIQKKFSEHFEPEDETKPGEYYIDSLGVSSGIQGQGIGSRLLQHLIDEYSINQKRVLSLLVDEEDPSAKKLYLKLGFVSVGKRTLFGKKMECLRIGESGLS